MTDKEISIQKGELRDFIFETVSKVLNENSLKSFSRELVDLIEKEFPQKDVNLKMTLKKTKLVVDGLLFEIKPESRQEVVFIISFRRFETWKRPDKDDYDRITVRDPSNAVEFIREKVDNLLGENIQLINEVTDQLIEYRADTLKNLHEKIKNYKTKSKREKNKKNLYLKIIKEVALEKYN